MKTHSDCALRDQTRITDINIVLFQDLANDNQTSIFVFPHCSCLRPVFNHLGQKWREIVFHRLVINSLAYDGNNLNCSDNLGWCEAT